MEGFIVYLLLGLSAGTEPVLEAPADPAEVLLVDSLSRGSYDRLTKTLREIEQTKDLELAQSMGNALLDDYQFQEKIPLSLWGKLRPHIQEIADAETVGTVARATRKAQYDIDSFVNPTTWIDIVLGLAVLGFVVVVGALALYDQQIKVALLIALACFLVFCSMVHSFFMSIFGSKST